MLGSACCSPAAPPQQSEVPAVHLLEKTGTQQRPLLLGQSFDERVKREVNAPRSLRGIRVEHQARVWVCTPRRKEHTFGKAR